MAVLGGAVFVIGMTVVTIVFNVPLNNKLAAADAESAQGVAIWSRYLADWTMWNHVRTVTSTIASILFIAAIASR